jgi:NitT/TauT family transport system ATP-binding protein
MTAKISVRNLFKSFPTANGEMIAIQDFSLDVQDGEFMCIVGPSGCGKSTLLRILAGLIEQSSGEVTILPGDDPRKPLNNVVFQEYAIFPWKTVRDNVAFGLQMRGVSKKDRYDMTYDWLERVGLLKFAEYYPSQLSGGMKQRVSIARALANDPEVLLMDEPLGALDAQTRAVLQEELLRIWESTRKTVVYITHSIEEAVLLGDRVVIMTAQPGTLKTEFRVDIPRPRTFETTSMPEFAELNGAIWNELKDEVHRAMEQQR